MARIAHSTTACSLLTLSMLVLGFIGTTIAHHLITDCDSQEATNACANQKPGSYYNSGRKLKQKYTRDLSTYDWCDCIDINTKPYVACKPNLIGTSNCLRDSVWLEATEEQVSEHHKRVEVDAIAEDVVEHMDAVGPEDLNIKPGGPAPEISRESAASKINVSFWLRMSTLVVGTISQSI